MIIKIHSKAHNEKVQNELERRGFQFCTIPFYNGDIYCFTHNGNFMMHSIPKPNELTEMFNDEFEIDLVLRERIIKTLLL